MLKLPFIHILDYFAEIIGIWRLFCFLEILSCWVYSNLEMMYLICQDWMPNIIHSEQIETTYWIMPMNSECILWGDMLSFSAKSDKMDRGPWSFLDKSVEVDGGKTWYWPCSVLTWDAVGMKVKQPSLLRPSGRSQHHGGRNMRSVTKGTWVVAVIGRCVGEPSVFLFSTDCICVCNDEINLWAPTK